MLLLTEAGRSVGFNVLEGLDIVPRALLGGFVLTNQTLVGTKIQNN